MQLLARLSTSAPATASGSAIKRGTHFMATMIQEDLNLNNIVSKQFDRAARYLTIDPALRDQIKACNNVYYFQFPVRFADNHFEIFEGWRAEHSQHRKPVKGGTR